MHFSSISAHVMQTEKHVLIKHTELLATSHAQPQATQKLFKHVLIKVKALFIYLTLGEQESARNFTSNFSPSSVYPILCDLF